MLASGRVRARCGQIATLSRPKGVRPRRPNGQFCYLESEDRKIRSGARGPDAVNPQRLKGAGGRW